jgi:L-ribulokinase
LKPGESGLLALDWNNGNRTILVDQRLTGLLVGQTLYTTPAEVYRALIEATAFGALTIINRFEEYGVKISTGRQLRRHRGEKRRSRCRFTRT